MATKRKMWYHYTAEAMLVLMTLGILSVTDLPTYYCDMEDSVRQCLFIKDKGQTCVYPAIEDNQWTSIGDRCQKGYTRGIWELTDNFVRIPSNFDDAEKIYIERPIIMTGAKVSKDLEGQKYIEGHCASKVDTTIEDEI